MLFRSVYFRSKTLTVADLFEFPDHECQYSYLLNYQRAHIMFILETVQGSAAEEGTERFQLFKAQHLSVRHEQTLCAVEMVGNNA